MAKPGLYANIWAKRRRIAAGSGEKMRKPGSKGAPSTQDWKDAAKTAKEEYTVEENKPIKQAEREYSPADHEDALNHFAKQYKMAKLNNDNKSMVKYAQSYHKYASKLDKMYHKKLKESTIDQYMRVRKLPAISTDFKGNYAVLDKDGGIKASFSRKDYGRIARLMAASHLRRMKEVGSEED